ncbi:MAG: hypothetical protein P1V13_16565 [Rhizobiaceae bacterium]|nr:hypothetical protein [Rhizobiaceae bacterium]
MDASPSMPVHQSEGQIMNDEDAIKEHLNAAYQHAQILKKPILCYLIEMAILESDDVCLEFCSEDTPSLQGVGHRPQPLAVTGCKPNDGSNQML